MKAFWVTVEHARGRTRDHRISAPTLWSAGWLWRQLHPDQTVLMVREVKG